MDPRRQKTLDAGIQALAVFNGAGTLINREVMPRAMEVLDKHSKAMASLDRAIPLRSSGWATVTQKL